MRKNKLNALIISGCIGMLLFTLAFIPSGYFIVGPGPIVSLGDAIDIPGYPSLEPGIFMVSVSVENPSVLKSLWTCFFSGNEFWQKSTILSGMSETEYQEWTRRVMEDSKEEAIRQALLFLDEKGEGVGEIDSSSVTINVGGIGGPSAGLAFTVEIVDRIYSGAYTRGRKVAATGVVMSDGSIGPVGGIAQKVTACENEGVQIFLVPEANLHRARKVSKSVTILGVRDLSQAFKLLSEEHLP
jgi:PDZ domain-containing secreted protein